MSAIYRTWVARIDSGVFTKAQCRQWANAVYPLARGGQARGAKTNLTQEEAGLLTSHMYRAGGVRLTPAHEAQGIDWLRKYGTRQVGVPKDVIDNFDHFTFHGQASDIGHRWEHWVPVWRIHCTDGHSVDYFTVAWQAAHYQDGPAASWWWVDRVEQPT